MSETISQVRCIQVKELLEAQKPHLERAINDNKWYLSEREHKDVGWNAAEYDFLENHLKSWAAGFKVCYCNYVCPNREDCKMKEVAGK